MKVGFMPGIPARIREWFKVYLMLHDRATKKFSMS